MKVVIAGAGPVGLIGAHLLGQLGVSVSVIEKKPSIGDHPSAHYLQSRSMEILREIGLASLIKEKEPPVNHWRSFIYCNSIRGPIYRKHDHFASSNYKELMNMTEMPPSHYPQHRLLNLLNSSLPSTVSLHLNEEISEIKQGQDGVQATCKSGSTYEGTYLIGCDGAKSAVRSILNIESEGTKLIQAFLNIHFISKELTSIALENPAMVYHVFNNKFVGGLVMHDASEAEFILQAPIFHKIQNLEDYTREELLKIIESVAGICLKDVDIKSTRVWHMIGRNAKQFRKGRCFLAGDSAHQMPPSGGFGLNTGIGDIHNLYWKLWYPELLDSYQEERLPFAKDIIDYSFFNYNLPINVSKNMGLNVKIAQLFSEAVQWLPYKKNIFNNCMKLGQRLLFTDKRAEEYLSNDSNLINLVFPEQDLGYHYQSGFFRGDKSKLVPHQFISYKGKEYPVRQLLAELTKENGKPTFLYLKGKKELDQLDYPTITLPSEDSYLIRPDSHVYDFSS